MDPEPLFRAIANLRTSAVAQASARWESRGVSAPNPGRVASIAARREHDRREQTVQRGGIGPTDFDLEHFDAAARLGGQSHEILCRRDQAGVLAIGRDPAQFGNLDGAEG